ncbi:Protein NHR-76, partial [Aphelenchoides avenae]
LYGTSRTPPAVVQPSLSKRHVVMPTPGGGRSGFFRKTTIVKIFLKTFYYFESFYRTCVNDGHRTNRIYRADYTYIQVRTTEEIAQWDAERKTDADEAFHESNAAVRQDEGISAYIPKLNGKPRRDSPYSAPQKRTVFMNRGNQANIHATFRQTLDTVVAQMEKIGLTEAEFVAMCLLLVFEPNREHLSEISKKVLSQARDQLFKEWAELYATSGAEDGDERLGNCVLLLASVRQQVHHHHSIAHMFRLFGMTDYDRIIDDVYM